MDHALTTLSAAEGHLAAAQKLLESIDDTELAEHYARARKIEEDINDADAQIRRKQEWLLKILSIFVHLVEKHRDDLKLSDNRVIWVVEADRFTLNRGATLRASEVQERLTVAPTNELCQKMLAVVNERFETLLATLHQDAAETQKMVKEVVGIVEKVKTKEEGK